MADLLPPSPTTLYTNFKPFTPTPSHLNSSFIPSDAAHLPTANSTLPNLDKSNGATQSLPSPDLRSAFPPPASASFPATHRRGASLPFTYPPVAQIRKLDFGSLVSSHEETHAELEHIVDDLVQWLSIAELGMTGLLERASEDRIEEETEDTENSADMKLQDADDNKELALAAR